MAEAVSVCLDSQQHKNRVTLSVKGAFNGEYLIYFGVVTSHLQRSHGDAEVATEYGAYGISILLIDANTEFTVIERSRKGTRFDYWLGRNSPSGINYQEKLRRFQDKSRLEASGIRKGTDGDVNSRMRTKLAQIARSDDSLPAYVIVVEFGSPKARVVEQ
ncbi:MAG TPA: hypothetical protein VMW67_01375 [Desulfobacteria bacterium]|nr:hypothetical protein [Desulfobacteria bacterium]